MNPSALATRSRLQTPAESSVGQVLIVLFALVFAVGFGFIATTGQPLFIAMTLGALFGAYTLSQPKVNVWLILCLGLCVVGLVPLWAGGMGAKAVWAISLLGFVLLGSTLFRLVTNFNDLNRATPLFVWLALWFLVYSTVNGLLQSSTYEFVAGSKRYFQAIAMCFALAWMGFNYRSIKNWQWLFLGVLLIQLPFVLYERFSLVPIREAIKFAYPGMIPVDVVAGTFGASKYGGGSNAEMATFLMVALAFVLARFKEQQLPKKTAFWLGLLALTPLFLGETKIVIVFLPLIFITLYQRDLLNRPIFAVVALLVGGLLTVAAAFTYLQFSSTDSLSDMIDFAIEYNFESRGYGGYYLNRITSLTFWWQQQGLHDPTGFLFGHGVGTAHEGTGGSIAARYFGYGIGVNSLSILLWEQGLAGAALFYGILLAAWFTAGKLRDSVSESRYKADLAAIQCALTLLLVYPIYRPSLLEGLPFQIVFWSLLGYLAWLYRDIKTGGERD